MKIGYFGDSYVDLIWHHYADYHGGKIPRKRKPWSLRLLEDTKSPIICSGLGGSNQYYAINKWFEMEMSNQKFDYAIWTFTWFDRLYNRDINWQEVLSADAERRDAKVTDAEEIKEAVVLYYKYLYSEEQLKFQYELMMRWCFELAEQNPDTKFIFLPNTEFARSIAPKHFTKGVLVDFAFETLSNLETDSPGIMPVNCGRPGHLNDTNHELMTKFIRDIMINYEDYRDQVLPFDYGSFDTKSLQMP
jgi:hypothetical protein